MKRILKSFYSTVSGKNRPEAAMTARFFKNNYLNSQEGQSQGVCEDEVKAGIFKILENIDSNLDANDPNLDANLYVGSAGIAYMFYYLSKQPHFSQYKQSYLFKAETYLTKAIDITNRSTSLKDIPGFILGNCGIYAIATAYYNAIGNANLASKYRNMYFNAAGICKERTFLKRGADELFVGRAGYVAGALWLSRETNTDLRKDDIYDICNAIVNSGLDYSQKTNSMSPLMYAYYDVEYLGAAHGLCLILQVLMSVPGYLESHPKEAIDIKNSVDYLLSLQDSEGNFPCATDELQKCKNELVHWCHGAPGTIYTMAKAYLVFKEEKYLKSCYDAADVIWKKGLLKKGPGICHGIAGNAYAFLLMFRLTGDSQFINKAAVFAKFMQTEEFKTGARIPDCPYSLYEGIAGTACFLNDLLVPQNAAFPFSDVF